MEGQLLSRPRECRLGSCFWIGHVLGGGFTDKALWNLWINLPCSGLAFVVLVLFLDVQSPKITLREGLKSIDCLGSVAILSSPVMFLMGLDFGSVSFPCSCVTSAARCRSSLVESSSRMAWKLIQVRSKQQLDMRWRASLIGLLLEQVFGSSLRCRQLRETASEVLVRPV